MMNDLVQWRQVPLLETKLANPSLEKSQQHKKPHHSYRFFCQILVQFSIVSVLHTKSANNFENVHKI